MNLIISNDINDLSIKLADWIADYIMKTLQQKSAFSIVLSGGNTPKTLYQQLSSPVFIDKIDWSRVHFFWGDERYVPFHDERNNAKMAYTYLLDHIPVKKENIHAIQTDIDPEKSAAAYEQMLHEFFPDKNKSFDLVLLGMGDNAHTLSLFPEYEILHEKKRWVVSFFLREQDMFRISLTAPLVNAAGRTVFIVSGADKAASLYHVLSNDLDPDLYPSQLIQPFNGELYWWVDKAAANDLE